jgi:hypothetical protein
LTTLAYRDGVLAADTLWVGGGTRDGYGPKIERIGNLLVGMSGSIPMGLRFRAWVASGFAGACPLDDCPDGNGLIIWPHGVVGWCSRGAWPVSEPFYTLGSGEQYAMGALAMGATAEEAVRVAMRFDVSTGGEITVLKL